MASAEDSVARDTPSISREPRSSGWAYARSGHQASRGRIHRIRAGGTPLTGRNRTPGSTVNDGVWVAGTAVSREVASTALRRTRTVVPSPVTRDTTRRPPDPSAAWSDMPRNTTRPEASSCSSSTRP